MSISVWFSNQKIYKKLILINAVSITMALVPLVAVILGYEYYAVRKAVLQEIRVQADIVSDNAAAALAFSDVEVASEALQTLEAASSVTMAVLFLPTEKVLASYKGSLQDSAIDGYQNLGEGEELLTFNRFVLKRPVFLNSEHVGSIVLEASLEAFYKRILLFLVVVLMAAILALILSFMFARVLRTSIARPLSALISSVHRVTQKGDFSVRPKALYSDEIGDLSNAFGEMMNNIQERDQRLQDLAFYDEITGLANRNFFQEHIKQAVKKALRDESSLALMFIDLDDFKHVNDTLGHDVGDQLLKHVGGQLKASLRETDRVFRIGGDEFGVVLENVNDLDATVSLAEKIINTAYKPFVVNGQVLSVTMSIGISYCPLHAKNASDLLKFADLAMYVAKDSKNAYHLYSP